MTERPETSPQQAMSSLLLAARVDPTLRAWAQVADKGLTDAYAEIDALRSELEAMRPLPAESMALTVALAQMLRGETPTPNVSTVVMWAAARMAGMATFDPDLGYVPAARSVRNGE